MKAKLLFGFVIQIVKNIVACLCQELMCVTIVRMSRKVEHILNTVDAHLGFTWGP